MKSITVQQLKDQTDSVLKMVTDGDTAVVMSGNQPTVYLSKYQIDTVKELNYLHQLTRKLITEVIPLGIRMAAEKDLNKLLEQLLHEAQDICHADGGTLYLRARNHELKFVMLRTKSLGFHIGGTSGKPVNLPPLKTLDDSTGKPNDRFASTWVCINGKTLNIPDVYSSKDFDFTGTRSFDQANNYKTTSCLTVPMKDVSDHVVGVIQLINASDPATGKVIGFNTYLQQTVEALASLAAAALLHHLEKLKG